MYVSITLLWEASVDKIWLDSFVPVVWVDLHSCAHACVRACAHVHVCVCMLYVCVCACVCVCVCVCVFVCV